MKNNREINQQVLNTAVDKKGRPTINLDKRKSIYESVTEALRAIPVTNRNVGLTIPIYNGVKVVEYWWEKGIKDSDFVKKIDSENIPRINSTLTSLQNQIDSISSFEFKVVLSLPTKGKSGIIYVVPAAVHTSTNIYDEYFWIESAQTYERWGGVNPEGDVIINNAFTFNENHFNIVNEYGIQNVSLKCDILDVTDKGFDIYKLAVGEDDNEILLSAEKISTSIGKTSSYGGKISLNGKLNAYGRGITTFGSIFSFDTLSLNSDHYGASELFLAQPNYLKIANNTNYIQLSGDSIEVYSNDVKIFDLATSELNIEVDKFFINTQETNGFSLIVDDTYGISAYKINENIGMGVNIFTDHSKVAVRSNTITLESSKVSATNLYLTDTQGSIQKGFEALYDTYYSQLSAGIRATCSIWVQNTDLFGLRSTSNSSRTLLRLNDIVYRKSTTASTYGNSIISWNENTNKYPELKLGWDSQIQILEDRINIENGDAHVRVNNDGECGFYTLMNSDIKILNSGDIKLDYVGTHEIYIGEHGSEYINGINLKSNNIKLGLGSYYDNSYIRLYYDNLNDEQTFEVRGTRFLFRDYTGNDILKIDSDNDIVINPGNYFSVVGSSSVFFYFGYDNDIKVHASANNYFNMDSTKVYVKNSGIEFYNSLKFEEDLGKVGLSIIQGKNNNGAPVVQVISFKLNDNLTVQFTESGVTYHDGTNTYTKTWAQLLS